jgi:plasmid stabilization system protein ParE
MARVIWTAKSLEDMKSLLTYISMDAPIAAKRFGQRIVSRVNNLGQNPYLGGFIAENREKIYRELIQGNYRVIYRTDGRDVHIITIRHAARLLDVDSLD